MNLDTHELKALAARMQSIAVILMIAGRSEKEAAGAAMSDALADPRRREVLQEVMDIKTLTPARVDAQAKFASFFADRIRQADGSSVSAKNLYQAMLEWWAQRRPMEDLPTPKALGAALRCQGIRKVKKGGAIHYLVVSLL